MENEQKVGAGKWLLLQVGARNLNSVKLAKYHHVQTAVASALGFSETKTKKALWGCEKSWWPWYQHRWESEMGARQPCHEGEQCAG